MRIIIAIAITITILLFTNFVFATVPADESIVQDFNCDGNETTYTFTQKGYTSSDFRVYKYIIADGNLIGLTKNIDYTIIPTGGSYLNGGVITIDPPFSSAYQVIVKRHIVRSQELAFPSVTPRTVETALDKLIRIAQDIDSTGGGGGGDGVGDMNVSLEGFSHSLLSSLDFDASKHTGFERVLTKGNLTVSSPLVKSTSRQVIGGDVDISLPVGNLTAASNKVIVTGGIGAVIGTGATIDVDTGNIPITGLLGYNANKYIDHTGVSITPTSPLTGGGTIAANRTLGLAGLTGIGGANYLIGVKSTGTEWEAKQLIAGSNISITHGTGSVTLSSSGGGGGGDVNSFVHGDYLSTVSDGTKISHGFDLVPLVDIACEDIDVKVRITDVNTSNFTVAVKDCNNEAAIATTLIWKAIDPNGTGGGGGDGNGTPVTVTAPISLNGQQVGLDYNTTRLYLDSSNKIDVNQSKILHNSLGSLQGGTTSQYYHLTSAQQSALHSSVTITDVPLTLIGQELTFNYNHDDFETDGNDLILKDVVRMVGDQNVDGIKNFTSFPTTPNADAMSALQVVNLRQLNATAGSQIIQVVNYQTADMNTGKTAIPYDITIPQITEGNQFMSCSITPTSATNKLKIDVIINLQYSSPLVTPRLTVALFQDTTVNALAVTCEHGSSYINHILLSHYMTAGTTSETTFRVRAGGTNGAYNVTFNGDSGSKKFGGVLYSSITITEIKGD